MPPKAKDIKTDEKKKKSYKKISCGVVSPGPKYKLKTLVGYNDHCQSKYRNPAFSIGYQQTGTFPSYGPGPIYNVTLPRKPGFSIGYRMNPPAIRVSPGPYYYDKPKCSPKFSIRFRTQERRGDEMPGPYLLPDKICGPVFSLGMSATGRECSTPGPSPPYKIDMTKPTSPSFSIGFKQTSNFQCIGPGPKYLPKMQKKSFVFSFGTKHSECSPPLITECDEKC